MSFFSTKLTIAILVKKMIKFLSIFWKKCQVFGNLLTFNWQCVRRVRSVHSTHHLGLGCTKIMVNSSLTSNYHLPRCVICMNEFLFGDELRYLPCMHCYHRECIDDWLMRSFTCPSCMEPVDAALLTTYQTSWSPRSSSSQLITTSIAWSSSCWTYCTNQTTASIEPLPRSLTNETGAENSLQSWWWWHTGVTCNCTHDLPVVDFVHR